MPQLAWIAESSLVEASLDAALRFQPNLTWFDARAQGFDVRDDAAVLTLSSGQVLEADLVVGADGAHSWVRSQMGAKVERRDYRQTGVVANFKASLPHRETAYQWFHEGEIVALLPLPDGHVSLVWSAHTAHADELLALDPAQLAAEVERMSHGQAGTLDCVTPAAGFAGAADGRQADRTARRARRRCRAPDPPARGAGMNSACATSRRLPTRSRARKASATSAIRCCCVATSVRVAKTSAR